MYNTCAYLWVILDCKNWQIVHHNKEIHLFVNKSTSSLLRYGLPVNFQAMLLEPGKKQKKRLKEVLFGLYSHLDSANTKDSANDVRIRKWKPKDNNFRMK